MAEGALRLFISSTNHPDCFTFFRDLSAGPNRKRLRTQCLYLLTCWSYISYSSTEAASMELNKITSLTTQDVASISIWTCQILALGVSVCPLNMLSYVHYDKWCCLRFNHMVPELSCIGSRADVPQGPDAGKMVFWRPGRCILSWSNYLRLLRPVHITILYFVSRSISLVLVGEFRTLLGLISSNFYEQHNDFTSCVLLVSRFTSDHFHFQFT